MFQQYILWGVVSMASAEFQGNVLLRGNPFAWVAAMVLYAVLTAIAYGMGKLATSDTANLKFYFIGGGIGLIIIEWILVGFYPGSGKPGIHAAMFTNWAVVFTLPRLFTAVLTDEILAVQHRVRKIVKLYSFGAPVLVLISPIGRGGAVAILMTLYSLVLSYQLIPFLTQNEVTRRKLRKMVWGLSLAAFLNLFFL